TSGATAGQEGRAIRVRGQEQQSIPERPCHEAESGRLAIAAQAHLNCYTSGGCVTPFKRCKSLLQGLFLLPALRVITHNGGDPRAATVRRVEQGHCEGDREALAFLVEGRHP